MQVGKPNCEKSSRSDAETLTASAELLDAGKEFGWGGVPRASLVMWIAHAVDGYLQLALAHSRSIAGLRIRTGTLCWCLRLCV